MSTRRIAPTIAFATVLFTVISNGQVLAATELDQEASVDTGVVGLTLDSSVDLGQVFTAGISGSLTSAAVNLYTLSGTPSLSQHVYAVDPFTSVPTGAALASQTITPGPSAWTWIETTFSSPISVTVGTQYALVVTSSDVTTQARWARGFSYPGGSSVLGASGTWIVITGSNAGDFAFRTYVTTEDPSSPTTTNLTPGAMQQQIGEVGTNSCSKIDDSTLGFGTEVHGGWTMSWAQWANDGAGGSVCTRTLTYEVNSSRWSAG